MGWTQKYEARGNWILQMLNAFYSVLEDQRRNKFDTKLDGVAVCNACYAAALGYLQRPFKQLRQSHLMYGRIVVVHGNV